MGIDYSAYLAIGFTLTCDEIDRALGRETEERAHLEDRFDPRTGKKLPAVKVVDEAARTTWRLPGLGGEEEYDDREMLVEALCQRLDATFWTVGSYMDGDLSYVVGPRFETDEDDAAELGRVSIGGSVPFHVVEAMGPQLERMRGRLTQLGLEVGKPTVGIAWLVS